MKRFAQVAQVGALCVLLAGIGGGAVAQTEENPFGGFTIGAVAATQSWTYNQPSTGIPAEPTGELNFVYTQAELDTGPRGYGLASLAWPGQVAANAPGLVYGRFCEGASQGDPEFCDRIPVEDANYPVRAETFYPQGPTEEIAEPGLGLRMRSSASPDRVAAISAADRSGFEGFVSMGTQTSTSTSEITDGLAIADAKATASEISLLAGFVTIESVTSRAVATSDGEVGKVGGGVTVTGMQIDGHPVRIDGNGIHLDGNDVDPGIGILRQQLKQALAQAGITFALAEPIDVVSGHSASRSVGGLIVGMSSATFKEYAQQLPDQIREEIERNYEFDQTVLFTIAGVAADAAATTGSPFDFGFGDVSAGGSFDTSDPSGGISSSFQEFGDGGSTAEVLGSGAELSPPATGSQGALQTGVPVSFPGTFDGIPLFLIAGALLLAAASSRFLAHGADVVLAADAGASGGCPFGADGD